MSVGGAGRADRAGEVGPVEDQAAQGQGAPAAGVTRGSAGPRPMGSGAVASLGVLSRLQDHPQTTGPARPVEAIRADLLRAMQAHDDKAILGAVDEVARPVLDAHGQVPAHPDAAALTRFMAVADPLDAGVYESFSILSTLAGAAWRAGPGTLSTYDALFAAGATLPPVSFPDGEEPIGTMGPGGTVVPEPNLHGMRWGNALAGQIQGQAREEFNSPNPADRFKLVNRLMDQVLTQGPAPKIRPDADPETLARARLAAGASSDGGHDFESLVKAARAAGHGTEARLGALFGKSNDWFQAIQTVDGKEARARPQIAAAYESVAPLLKDPQYANWTVKDKPAAADVQKFNQALAAVPKGDLERLVQAGGPPGWEEDFKKLDAAIRANASPEMKQKWEQAVVSEVTHRAERALDQGIPYPAAKALENAAYPFTRDGGNYENHDFQVKPDANPADIARYRNVLLALQKDGRMDQLAAAMKEGGGGAFSGERSVYTGIVRTTQLLDRPAVGAPPALVADWRRAVERLGIPASGVVPKRPTPP